MNTTIIIATVLAGGIFVFFMRNSMEDPAVHKLAVVALSACVVFFSMYAIFDEVYRFRLLFFAIFSASVLTYRIRKFKQVSQHKG